MSLIDKIRKKQGLEAPPAAPPAPPDAPPALPPAPADPAQVGLAQADKRAARKARKDAGPQVKYRCGHERPLAHLTVKDCPACREKAQQEKRALKKAGTRNQRKAEQRLQKSDAQRLPDGAVYLKTYDAALKEWTVTLTIPGLPVFTAKGSGSFRTETVIDAMYREWLEEANAKRQP